MLREQQSRSIHVEAGDVGVDIDRARHDDLAACVVGRVGAAARRGGDDAAVAHPHVADAVAIVRGIDDAAARDARQHGQAPRSGRWAAITAIASATEIAPLGLRAFAWTSVPMSAQYSTPS